MNVTRVYADGIYDLFHYGHARSLEQIKIKLFEGKKVHLIVGCCSDEVTHARKGQTVLTDWERYESLRHCRWVDEVVKDAPWELTEEFLTAHRIDYVVHDNDGHYSYDLVKSLGKFKVSQRTPTVSSTDIINRILQNYNLYLIRNLQRGFSRKDLGVSFLKDKELMVRIRFEKLRYEFINSKFVKKKKLWYYKWRNILQNLIFGYESVVLSIR